MPFSWTCRTKNISKNENLHPHQSRITLPSLLWDTLYHLLKFSQILYLSTFHHSISVWTLSTNLLMWAFLTCADCCCCSSLSRLVTKQSWNEMRDLQFTEKSVKLGNIFIFFLSNDLKKFSWGRSPLIAYMILRLKMYVMKRTTSS